jgi:RHS repeat-associated protein
LGYRDDGDLGLMHVGARYYDPDVGRFITRDPVLSEHPYVYCGADPVNGLDPDGLCCLRQAGRASGVLEGSLGGLVLELGSCITDKLCVDACTRTGIPQGPCRKLCASFRGSTCAALWRYCEHLGRHRGGKTYAEICLAVHDTLCSGE